MMRREYNSKISQKANKNLSRRAQTVFFQKSLLAIAAVLLISITILLCSSIKAFAGSAFHKAPLYKYYTSICIQPGDTLWDIAEEYTEGTDVCIEDYMEEVCQLNHMNGQSIHAGEYLVVAYYTTEEK